MKLICNNTRGATMSFGAFAPCWLVSVDGLGSSFNVYTAKTSGQDGENYNGSDAQKRNIVFNLEISRGDFEKQVGRLYRFFQENSPGTLTLEGGTPKRIGYYVEKVDPEAESFSPAGSSPYETRSVTISLICPDPRFYSAQDSLTQLAAWDGLIEWDVEIREEPFALTEKVNTLIGNVHNDSSVPMGLTVAFTASGEVVNPSLYDINRHELMKINTTMHIGDKILITTGTGNKNVQLISGGRTFNINNLMAYPPKWLMAYEGDNLFRYDADSGIDSLSVSILSTQAYWGA
ncbi:phage tail domain-containing protein [Clostridium sp. KNHs216]|uniref:phage tail domain-containing protein n=1 Tax=Clostridium sp. KNHs216 TaxID=1550235 RepID=UPI00115372AA|nr:phage tail domain-containing protein [Clostridium sp. KNHs216]TQI66916.1 tail protein [Clostridium sp. KNHs216]